MLHESFLVTPGNLIKGNLIKAQSVFLNCKVHNEKQR